jgi:hypothetical protein
LKKGSAIRVVSAFAAPVAVTVAISHQYPPSPIWLLHADSSLLAMFSTSDHILSQSPPEYWSAM